MPARKKVPELTPAVVEEALEHFGEAVYDEWEEDYTEKRRTNADLGKETRWGKGVSGNPGGRPGQPDNLTDTLAWLLGKAGAKKLAQALIDMAIGEEGGKPNLQALVYIFDRLEGKPRQAIIETKIQNEPLLEIFRALTNESKRIPEKKTRALPVGGGDYSINAAEVREAAGEGSGSRV